MSRKVVNDLIMAITPAATVEVISPILREAMNGAELTDERAKEIGVILRWYLGHKVSVDIYNEIFRPAIEPLEDIIFIYHSEGTFSGEQAQRVLDISRARGGLPDNKMKYCHSLGRGDCPYPTRDCEVRRECEAEHKLEDG